MSISPLKPLLNPVHSTGIVNDKKGHDICSFSYLKINYTFTIKNNLFNFIFKKTKKMGFINYFIYFKNYF